MKVTFTMKLILVLCFFTVKIYTQTSTTYVNFFSLGSGIAEGGNTSQTFTINSVNDGIGGTTADGCVTMTGTTSISNGVFSRDIAYPTSGKTLGYYSTSGDLTYYIGVNWTSPTGTVTTVLDFYKGGTSTRVNLPIQFKVYDINAAACAAPTSSVFIDLVSVQGYSLTSGGTVSGTSQSPTLSSLVNYDSFTSNPITIKGDDFPGAHSVSANLNFSSTNKVHRIVFTYSCATGNPANNAGDPSACSTSPYPISGATDPRGQHYLIGGMTIANINCATLPITLLDFNVKCQSDLPLITWSTASEQNNNYFSILRSSDGVNYNSIATINSQGNGNGTQNYSFTDNNPLGGYSYYKLKQTDFDNSETEFESKPYFKNCSDLPFDIIVLSNPFSNELSLNLKTTVSAVISMSIYDVLGQEVKKVYDNEVLEGETTSIKLNTDDLAHSMYFLTGYINNEAFSIKLIKAD